MAFLAEGSFISTAIAGILEPTANAKMTLPQPFMATQKLIAGAFHAAVTASPCSAMRRKDSQRTTMAVPSTANRPKPATHRTTFISFATAKVAIQRPQTHMQVGPSSHAVAPGTQWTAAGTKSPRNFRKAMFTNVR